MYCGSKSGDYGAALTGSWKGCGSIPRARRRREQSMIDTTPLPVPITMVPPNEAILSGGLVRLSGSHASRRYCCGPAVRRHNQPLSSSKVNVEIVEGDV
jgi:hypothetical protein